MKSLKANDKKMTILINGDLLEQWKKECKRRGFGMSHALRTLIEMQLEEWRDKEGKQE